MSSLIYYQKKKIKYLQNKLLEKRQNQETVQLRYKCKFYSQCTLREEKASRMFAKTCKHKEFSRQSKLKGRKRRK